MSERKFIAEPQFSGFAKRNEQLVCAIESCGYKWSIPSRWGSHMFDAYGAKAHLIHMIELVPCDDHTHPQLVGHVVNARVGGPRCHIVCCTCNLEQSADNFAKEGCCG